MKRIKAILDFLSSFLDGCLATVGLDNYAEAITAPKKAEPASLGIYEIFIRVRRMGPRTSLGRAMARAQELQKRWIENRKYVECC